MDKLTNLKLETENAIHHSKHEVSDVKWIGSASGEYAISWDEFSKIAENVNYDDGFGAQKIASDLVIVFKDGTWLERGEYDGSEWWEFMRKPELGKTHLPFTKVTATSGWCKIKEINSEVV